ncbi:hypothetical protein A6R68_13855 [Neotoma lepida]|uniref:Cytochrome c oxidase subunit 3 n=1 Tax=Neotoma lepida TaxID=56216 RepID=A0A1A6GZ07_NEOLE|nr:hypothetical protein A6R68_13855 [Neotoma lepida]
MISNTSIPNNIYWIHKPLRTVTTYVYPYNPTINKPRNGHSTMSRSRTPISLNPILIIIKTISLFIQSIALAVRFTANLTAGRLLIHLIGGATLVLISISPTTATITFIILALLTILEFSVALIQAYLAYIYMTTHNDPSNTCLPHTLRASEYFETSFSISDGIYGSTLFTATGFPGLHIIIGSTFLTKLHFYFQFHELSKSQPTHSSYYLYELNLFMTNRFKIPYHKHLSKSYGISNCSYHNSNTTKLYRSNYINNCTWTYFISTILPSKYKL